jgi:hypothetical protein
VPKTGERNAQKHDCREGGGGDPKNEIERRQGR